ncbi:sugar phosphate isomerase/epimerase family protein [Nocardioides zeicaulis]|uniref:Sugar phosphate isomerase/epimerase family protein n=1 Tax=Nocardioides zeicaulis TaxID=1776857 RepID=A0ABV6DWQ6_9ACTN
MSPTPAADARLSINQATAQTTAAETFLEACAAGGVRAVAPWRHQYVGGQARTMRRALDQHGLRASSLCRGGFFTGTRPADEAARDNRAAVEEAAELGAPILVLVCGPVTPAGPAVAVDAIRRGIEELLPHAVEHDVTLAVEPFHPMLAAERSAIVTLDQAISLVDAFDHPRLGVAVDTYHVWWDPDILNAIDRSRHRTVAVHVADWLVPTTDLLAGRGLPGDGIVDLSQLLRTLEETGYDGDVEVEVMNPIVWSTPVDEVVADVRTRMRTLLPVQAPG